MLAPVLKQPSFYSFVERAFAPETLQNPSSDRVLRVRNPKTILITGAGGSAGNNVCWSLRASPDGKQLSLIGTDIDRTSLELNRWIDEAYEVPKADDRTYLTTLRKIIRNKRVDGIFPQPDPEVRTIAESENRLETKFFLPEPNVVKVCLDKLEALRQWNAAGVRAVPVLISARKGKLNNQLKQVNFPCWVRAREGAGGLMSCLAKDARTLEYWVRFHWSQGISADFVAEEYLPGRDYCFMSIWAKGTLVTSMIRERLSWVGHRTVGAGGTSKLNHVVHLDSVNKAATEAINAISANPNGVLCVDLKEDVSGTPKPTEINCRFTTNVHYLTLASVKYGRPEWNFPWLASRLMISEHIPSCSQYDALPDNLWFTKNIDMGFTVVEDNKWRAAVLR